MYWRCRSLAPCTMQTSNSGCTRGMWQFWSLRLVTGAFTWSHKHWCLGFLAHVSCSVWVWPIAGNGSHPSFEDVGEVSIFCACQHSSKASETSCTQAKNWKIRNHNTFSFPKSLAGQFWRYIRLRLKRVERSPLLSRIMFINIICSFSIPRSKPPQGMWVHQNHPALGLGRGAPLQDLGKLLLFLAPTSFSLTIGRLCWKTGPGYQNW